MPNILLFISLKELSTEMCFPLFDVYEMLFI